MEERVKRTLEKIKLSEYVLRAHTVPFLKEQSIASHMGRCGMILILLYRKGFIRISEDEYYELLEGILIHDLFEVEFGDIPFTTKTRLSLFEVEFLEEIKVQKEFNLKFYSSPNIEEVKSFVDLLEFYLKVKEEESLGNKHPKLLEVKERAYNLIKSIVENSGIISPEVLNLIEEKKDG